MIDIQNVTLIKSGQKHFRNFNWTIKKEEHWVISGPNASGKTLLLELLAGKAHIKQGKVHYDFIQAKDWNTYFDILRRHIRYIPAHAAHLLLKKYQGLFYQQRYYGSFNENIPSLREILGDQRNAMNSLSLPPSLNIQALLDLPLTRLSNGQFKKVLIIQQLLQGEARLLLMDYPFEGLDHDSRKDLSDFIDHIALTHNVQIVLTDHYHHLPKVINRRLVLPQLNIHEVAQDQEAQIQSVLALQKKGTKKAVSTTAAIVEMKNLSIRYGEKIILQDFNWTIHQGERWALCGNNGSGKTTLFSLIYADHPSAYSQEIYLFGKRRGSGESIWDIKKRVNYLGPELISFLQPKGMHESGYAYISNHQKSLDSTKFEHLIDYFQADTFIHQPVSHYSSGQLQLLLLMQCFLDEKELILLDEPFQFLDPQQKEGVSQYLQAYLDASKTLVLITHYEEDISRWSENVMYI